MQFSIPLETLIQVREWERFEDKLRIYENNIIVRYFVSMGSRGAWQPRNFRKSHMAPADFGVLFASGTLNNQIYWVTFIEFTLVETY